MGVGISIAQTMKLSSRQDYQTLIIPMFLSLPLLYMFILNPIYPCEPAIIQQSLMKVSFHYVLDWACAHPSGGWKDSVQSTDSETRLP